MKKILLILFIAILTINALATHNRAGEILYEQVSEFTFRITVLTYTFVNTGVVADRPELDVYWGDNTFSTVKRDEETFLPNSYKRNRYDTIHTFPGPGIYQIVVIDPNRNDGVLNIPGSVNVVFAIKTTLQINPLFGYNSAPKFLNPPLDLAAKNRIFIHNPGAYDIDGDSISFKLTTCLGENGQPIENYTLPPYTNTLYIDERTGDFVWDSPPIVGRYNVAILVEEWRRGVKIGQIIRDMQIDVVETDNEPPVITAPDEICVEAGTVIEFWVHATDPNNDRVKLEATGSPFQMTDSPASFPITVGQTSIKAKFLWRTNCSHVRKEHHNAVFRASDFNNSTVLVAFKTTKIKVIAPAPKNLTTSSNSSSIRITWDISECSNAVGYNIYRRISPSDFSPDSCETGVPAYTKFKLIGQTNNINANSFLDDKDGEGLWQGYVYCYRVTAFFNDGAESYSSAEICEELVRSTPILTHVSVLKTGTQEGEIMVRWAKPKTENFDTIAAPGPYSYRIYHGEGIHPIGTQKIDSIYNNLDSCTYIHRNINTKDLAHTYTVEFFNADPDNYFQIGYTPTDASSPFLDLYPSDNQVTLSFKKKVPWLNIEYIVFRQNLSTLEFDSIGMVTAEEELDSEPSLFVDKNLVNGVTYRYLTKINGYYTVYDIERPIINFSQINEATPIDTIPPCLPNLKLKSDCENYSNYLEWSNPNTYCSDDVVRYNIYYSPQIDKPMQILDSIGYQYAPQLTNFTHRPEKSLAGCYAVTAVDTFMNESPIGSRMCIDDCIYYQIPNIFTPNGDGVNDILRPLSYRYVEKVEIYIYDRWGGLVFETTDPDINWDGKHKQTKQLVNDGVYYYTCEVYESRLTGQEARHLVGFVHVLTSENSKKP